MKRDTHVFAISINSVPSNYHINQIKPFTSLSPIHNTIIQDAELHERQKQDAHQYSRHALCEQNLGHAMLRYTMNCLVVLIYFFFAFIALYTLHD